MTLGRRGSVQELLQECRDMMEYDAAGIATQVPEYQRLREHIDAVLSTLSGEANERQRALEEAATVADAKRDYGEHTAYERGRAEAAAEIAADIRALSGGKEQRQAGGGNLTDSVTQGDSLTALIKQRASHANLLPPFGRSYATIGEAVRALEQAEADRATLLEILELRSASGEDDDRSVPVSSEPIHGPTLERLKKALGRGDPGDRT